MSNIDSGYKKFIFDFHRTMVDNHITLVYEGEINQTITKAFSALTERNMSEKDASTTTTKRVYHVMIECLQNICKHSEDSREVDEGLTGSGIFVVGQGEDSYTITTGNSISNDKINGLTEMLNNLNSMNSEEVKEYYKKIIKGTSLSDRGGAGLGFIDIVKKTGNNIEFHFEPIDNETSFFILVSKIDK